MTSETSDVGDSNVRGQDVPYATRVRLDYIRRLARRAGTLTDSIVDAYECLVAEAERRARAEEPPRTDLALTFEQATRLVQSQDVLDALANAKLLTQFPDEDVPRIEVAPTDFVLTMQLLSSVTSVGDLLEETLSAWRAAGSIGHESLAKLSQGGDSTTNVGGLLDGNMFKLITTREDILALTGPFGLLSRAQKRFSEFLTHGSEMQFTETMARLKPPVLKERGAPYRVVYERSLLQLQAFHNGTRACIESGEEARVVDRLPVKMKIARGDRSADDLALIALNNTGASKALLARNAFVVDALQMLFDFVWKEAVPLEVGTDGRLVERALPGAVGLSPREQKIIQLSAQGMSASAIANALRKEGDDVSPRTVQRDRDEMRKKLGAASQFDFGVRAAIAGWVDGKSRDQSSQADIR